MHTFKQFKQLNEMSMTLDAVEFIWTKHFSDRMQERGVGFSMDMLKDILSHVREKVAALAPQGDFLFYSQKFKRGVVAAWDAFKRKMTLVTFLPKGKQFIGDKNPDTEKVYVESMQREYTVIILEDDI